MVAEEQVVLCSDGGADQGTTAASACILRRTEDCQVVKIVAFLGQATNNEAEIIAGLLGFSFLALEANSALTNVRWICDSEYVLKSATAYINTWRNNGWKTSAKKPVKNQGLWRAFLSLKDGLSITPEHVAGHTGHPENEACDSAVTWARAHGEEIISSQGQGALGEETGEEGQTATRWYLLDGREFLHRLREAELSSPSEEDCRLLVQQLKATEIDWGEGAELADTGSLPRTANAESDELNILLGKVQDARRYAVQIAKHYPSAKQIAVLLDQALKGFKRADLK
jgi:ribonuclease HI